MDILTAIQNYPESTSGGLAAYSGMDPSNARRACRRAIKRGEVVELRCSDGAPVFSLADGRAFEHGQRFLHGAEPANSGRSELVDDAVWEPSPPLPPPPSSASRALVPVAQAAFDSRLDATLRRDAAARRGQGGGMAVPAQTAALLNQAFVDDPDGTEALAGLQQAIEQRLAGSRLCSHKLRVHVWRKKPPI